jgi:fido (protein-threonine AMPylation protein)
MRSNQNPSSPSAAEKGKAPVDPKMIEETANRLIAEGGKAQALKQWEEAVQKFGEALENMYVIHPDRILNGYRSFSVG